MAIPSINPQQALDVIGTVTGSADPALLLGVGAVVLARTAGFMIVAPFFSSKNIPVTVRAGFAVILTAIVTPFVTPSIAPALNQVKGDPIDIVLLLANQILIGLMLGFVGAFIFYAIESAGRILDTQRGSNMSDIVAPQSGERTSPAGQFLMMVALMILVGTGQHMLILEGLIDSFRIFPATISLDWIGDPLRASATGKPEFYGVIAQFAKLSGDSLLLTLKIAAPTMISLMLADVLLGIINRGAPQVNVFALSQVIKGPIGIAALMVAIGVIITYIGDTSIPTIFHGDSSMEHLARMMQASTEAGQRAAGR